MVVACFAQLATTFLKIDSSAWPRNDSEKKSGFEIVPSAPVGMTPGSVISIRRTSRRGRGTVSSFCNGGGRDGRGREGCGGV